MGKHAFHLNRHGRVTSIYDGLGARNETARFVGCEEQGCSNELFLVAKPVHRSVSHDGFHSVGSEYLPVLFGREETGHKDVHPNAMGSPFTGEILGQIVHGALGGGVSEYP